MAPIHHWSPYLGDDDDIEYDDDGNDNDDQDGHDDNVDGLGDLLTGCQGIQVIPDQHR